MVVREMMAQQRVAQELGSLPPRWEMGIYPRLSASAWLSVNQWMAGLFFCSIILFFKQINLSKNVERNYKFSF